MAGGGARRGRAVKRCAVNAVTALYRALEVFGACWVPLPEDQQRRVLDEYGGTAPHGRLTGPGAGHPERLRQDVPLTSLELRLRRELDLR
ncbi:hypothetical protein KBZ94_29115 [Streptomyces sp. RM72]|uniref:DUF6059 family protein n=1 Tax=unclassified Streptomyces TaxID=2593676 RepID=UPI000A85B7DD|nr:MULTISPECIES: DUF6059 family protein [unclassified Streptomyces]MBQ0888925.1 hypothetical protein [Streptomyces sp. RM72]